MSDKTEEALAAYTLNMNQMRAYYLTGNGRFGVVGDDDYWLPYSPVDVDERVYVSLGDRSFDSGHEEALDDFIAALSEVATKAPKDADVVIKLSSSYGYEDERGEPEYEIGYWRDPTAKERAEREETNRKIAVRDARKAEEAARMEREEFERLKAKFESR